MSAIIREERIGGQRLIQGDCLAVMQELGRFDAVVTDPPYGIGEKWDLGVRFEKAGGSLWKGGAGWDNTTKEDELFAAMALSNGRAIVWGGNYYNLNPSRGYLIWDKMQTGFSLADSEMAWCSDPITPKHFRYARVQLASEGKQHPTQKPLPLMKWCLGFLPDAETILDPFMGSGTTGVACVKLGRKFTGIELDPEYFDIACKRVDEATRQPDMFVEAEKTPAPVQEGFDL